MALRAMMFIQFFLFSTSFAFGSEYLPKETLSSLQNINGTAVNLNKKKQTILYFWATWCPDCRDKMRTKLPEWNAMSNVQVIAVNTDRGADKAHAFVEKEKVQLVVARDESRELQKYLQIFSVPSWALLEEEGDKIKIISKGAGSEMPALKN